MKLFFPIIFKIFLILTIIIGCATTEEIKGTNPVELLKQGVVFGKKGQYNRSIAYFNKAIELNPRYAEAYNNRGIAYKNKGQYDKAISDFNMAIEINPRYAKAYHNRGLTYAKNKGQNDKAISDFNKTIELNPRYAMAYNGRGVIRYIQGEYDSACSDFRKACDLGICKGLYWIKKKGCCHDRPDDIAHRPDDIAHKPDDISVSTVKLHSPQIPKVSTPKGIMASLEFQSERSLEGYKLVLILDFQVNQGGVSRVKHYLYEGKTPRTVTKYSSGLFSMSPGQSGQIRFLMYTPQIQGPPSGRVGYPSYGQGRFFRLMGHKNVSICLCMCQDEKCGKRLKISNSIEESVKF